jgi:DUF971 family protein
VSIEPLEIIEEDESTIAILWSDNSHSKFFAADLRRKCPCAQCVNEWSGERTLKPESISDATIISSTSVVGRYALNFHFSDGHDTGIYSFQYLREIAPDSSN